MIRQTFDNLIGSEYVFHVSEIFLFSTQMLRLIKGDGEILEEMVSKDQHRRINREATDGDGRFFQNNTIGAGTFTDRY